MPQPGPVKNSGPPGSQMRAGGWASIVWTCTVGLASILALVIEGLEGNLKRVLIGLAVLAVFLGSAVAIIDVLREMGIRFGNIVIRGMLRSRWWVTGAATLIFVLALLLVVPDNEDDTCPDPVELAIMVPRDGAAEFGGIVQQFAEGYRDDDACLKATVTTFSANAPEAADALARHWTAEPDADVHPLRDLGPRPDLWITESATQLRDVRARTHDAAPFGDGHTIGWTPLVLAVPSAEGAHPADVERLDEPIPALLKAFAETGTPTVRADPEASYTALLHTRGLYRHGDSGGIDAARQIEHQLATDLEDSGLPIGDDTDLLCRHRELDSRAAVLTTERAMVAHNLGRPLGNACPIRDVPADPFVAYYPAVGASLDYTVADLAWPRGGEDDDDVFDHRRGAATDFIRWLGTDDGRQALVSGGIRPPEFTSQAPLDNTSGVIADAPFNPTPPDFGQLSGTLTEYGDARRPTQVLLAVDSSGSMANEVGQTRQSRFDLASGGVAAALGHFGTRDSFGLWLFPGSDGSGPSEMLRIESADDPAARRTEAVDLMAQQDPSGSTPLYRTIEQGLTTLDDSDTPETLSAMVVFTDGRDSDGRPSPESLMEQAGAVDVRLYVVAVGDASCAETRLDQIADVTHGACYDAGFDDIEAIFDTLFRRLWGGNGVQ